MKENRKLHIDLDKIVPHSSFTTYLVEGLTPEEMDEILNAQCWEDKERALVKYLNQYENNYKSGNLGTCWSCGYGIYGIRHFGGCLLVDIGNTCD